MSRVAHIDWETRSACDLKRAGLHVYAQHPTTEIILGSWCFDEGPIHTWWPGQPVPSELRSHIESGGAVWGHNVSFEIELCNNVGVKHNWPKLSVGQCHDTMALAYSMGLPGSLANAAAAVGLNVSKDTVGQRLMLQMCQPRKINPDGSIEWWDDESKRLRLAEYGKQDVIVERALVKRLMGLPPYERVIWELDSKINSRGIRVDMTSLAIALRLIDGEKYRLDSEMRKLTSNAVATCTATAQLTRWLALEGVDTEGVAKADILALLDDDNLPDHVRRVLLLRQEAAKSSTAKIAMMMAGADPRDHRIRGVFQYFGAGTGRWAGRRVQFQNLPRPKLSQDEIDQVFGLMKEVK